MTLVHTDESKKALKRYEKLWKRIKDLIRPINNNSDDYDKKYMKIRFSSDEDLPLKKILELHDIIIVVRSVFDDNMTAISSIHKFS